MKISTNARNIAIVIALALIVDLVKTGQTVAGVVTQALSLAFLAVFAWIGTQMYRQHRMTIYSLGTRNRAILYAALGVAMVLLTASSRMLNTSGGTVAWVVLLVAAGYAIYHVYRSSREY